MSEITFQCPFCQKEIAAPEELAGTTAQCPSCGKEIRVPVKDERDNNQLMAEKPQALANAFEKFKAFRDRKPWLAYFAVACVSLLIAFLLGLPTVREVRPFVTFLLFFPVFAFFYYIVDRDKILEARRHRHEKRHQISSETTTGGTFCVDLFSHDSKALNSISFLKTAQILGCVVLCFLSLYYLERAPEYFFGIVIFAIGETILVFRTLNIINGFYLNVMKIRDNGKSEVGGK